MSIVSDHVPSSAPSTPIPDASSHTDLLEQLKTQVPDIAGHPDYADFEGAQEYEAHGG